MLIRMRSQWICAPGRRANTRIQALNSLAPNGGGLRRFGAHRRDKMWLSGMSGCEWSEARRAQQDSQGDERGPGVTRSTKNRCRIPCNINSKKLNLYNLSFSKPQIFLEYSLLTEVRFFSISRNDGGLRRFGAHRRAKMWLSGMSVCEWSETRRAPQDTKGDERGPCVTRSIKCSS